MLVAVGPGTGAAGARFPMICVAVGITGGCVGMPGLLGAEKVTGG